MTKNILTHEAIKKLLVVNGVILEHEFSKAANQWASSKNYKRRYELNKHLKSKIPGEQDLEVDLIFEVEQQLNFGGGHYQTRITYLIFEIKGAPADSIVISKLWPYLEASKISWPVQEVILRPKYKLEGEHYVSDENVRESICNEQIIFSNTIFHSPTIYKYKPDKNKGIDFVQQSSQSNLYKARTQLQARSQVLWDELRSISNPGYIDTPVEFRLIPIIGTNATLLKSNIENADLKTVEEVKWKCVIDSPQYKDDKMIHQDHNLLENADLENWPYFIVNRDYFEDFLNFIFESDSKKQEQISNIVSVL